MTAAIPWCYGCSNLRQEFSHGARRGGHLQPCAHRPTRAIVERCIGTLKNLFRWLQRYWTLHYDPVKTTNIVTACGILRNICLHCNMPEHEPLSRFDDCDGGGSCSEDDRRLTGAPPSLRDKGHEVRLKKMKELCERRRH